MKRWILRTWYVYPVFMFGVVVGALHAQPKSIIAMMLLGFVATFLMGMRFAIGVGEPSND